MHTKLISNDSLPRHRWKVLGVGVAANVAFSMIIGGLPAAAVFLRSNYMLSNITLGFILSMMGLGVALSELPWGMLTDKWGDRPVLLTGLTGTATVVLFMSIFAVLTAQAIPSVLSLTLFVFFIGFIGSSVNGASGRAIMTWFTDSERGLAMSIRQTAVPMGYGLGAALFPLISDHYGFTVLYLFSAMVLLICATFAWRWLYEPNTQHNVTKNTVKMVSNTVKSPLKRPDIWRIVTAIGILCGPQFVLLTFGSVFLVDVGQVSVYVSSISLVAIQLGAMVSRIWSGHWTDKNKNRKRYLKTCSILSIAAFLVLACSGSMLSEFPPHLATTFLIIIFIISGVLISAWHGVAYTELAAMAGSKYVGTALAMGNTLVFIVLFLTPLIVPYLATHFSWTSVWSVATFCAIYSYVSFPKPDKSTNAM